MGLVFVLRRRNFSLGPISYVNTNKKITKNLVVSILERTYFLVIVALEFSSRHSQNTNLITTSFSRWGRGSSEEYPPINLGGDDSRYDPMDDKKPRAGQILWIRGLTRLQTQVSNGQLMDEVKFFTFSLQRHIFNLIFEF